MNFLIDELEKRGVEVIQPEKSDTGWVRMRLKRGSKDVRYAVRLESILADPEGAMKGIENMLEGRTIPEERGL